jgi:hypothetical protein
VRRLDVLAKLRFGHALQALCFFVGRNAPSFLNPIAEGTAIAKSWMEREHGFGCFVLPCHSEYATSSDLPPCYESNSGSVLNLRC